MKKIYSTREVAEMLSLNVETVRRKVRAGEIKSIKIGNRYRITEDEIKRLIGE